MYEAHWQLEKKPFENGLDEAFYYPSEVHQGALLKLRYAVENQRGAALLAGLAGSGKTMLVNLLATQLPERFSPRVHLVFPQMSPPELLAYLADSLGANSSGNTPVHQTVRRIEQALTENAAAGRHAVVAIDEAHLLAETDALETIRLLMNFEHQGQPSLTLLLVAQPDLLPVIDRMPGLEERLGVKCLLRAFSLEETTSYVAHRLRAAGAKQAMFEPEAIETLHHLTDGVARRINRLCDLALLIAYAEQRPIVTARQFESINEELVAVAAE